MSTVSEVRLHEASTASPTPVLYEAGAQGFRSPSEILPRPRLTEMLEELRATLILIAAPPGFGKTTLLAEWHEVDSRPFASVSLDPMDNNPIVLWSGLVEALRRAEPGFETTAGGTNVAGAVVPAAIRDLQSLDTEIVLVIDDYHVIENPACHSSLAYFLERAPANLTVAISTRADPPIPVARLRAAGRLVEIRAADLAFTESEGARFLNETLELDLPPEALAALHQRTEGWPVGIQLASLSLGGVSDRSELLARFGGSNRHVVDYLVEVVLDTLEPRLRRFLIETSILDSLCGPLCDEVTGTEGSTELLAECERANLFLVPLDDRREWYRYHRLFADVLRSQLLRSDPDLHHELHRRASSWFVAEGYMDEAVRHAFAAGEVEAAARLVEDQWPRLVEAGQTQTVLHWLEAFPDGVVEHDTHLSLAKAWAMSSVNRRDEAREALTAVEAGGADSSASERKTVEALTALLRACFPWGDVRGMLGGASRASELQGGQRSVWRAIAHLALGRARYFAGEAREAIVPLERAAGLAIRKKQWIVASTSKAILARALLDVGDEAAAESAAREAIELTELHGVGERPGSGCAYIALGAVRARTGDLDEAEPLLSTGLTRLRAQGEELYIAEALLTLAPVSGSRGERQEARALLAEAGEVLERCSDPGVLRARLEGVARSLTPAHRRIDGDSELTEREREVLEYLAQGLSKRETGKALFLSFNTIHSHTKSIYQKLRVSSRDAAVERARELGAIDVPTRPDEKPRRGPGSRPAGALG